MSVKHATVTVGVAAVSLTAGIADAAGDKYARSVVITNEGAATVFIGGSGVTTADYGHKLATGGVLTIDLGPKDEPFAIAATAGHTVRVLHVGV